MENLLMTRSIAHSTVVVMLSLGAIGPLAGCGGPGIGNAIAVDKFPDPSETAPDDYVINAGDTLAIQVWEQPNLSGSQPVRPDGKISLPLINDIQAAGKTPIKLKADLEGALKSMVLNPQVTVGVLNPKLPTISVMGEVGRQGAVDLAPGMGVAQAIAAAGGLTTFAHKDRIFVQRKTADKTVSILFSYDALLEGTGKASQFKLRPGDTIVVR
jgi:polysaccharide biosynthesis/export protein